MINNEAHIKNLISRFVERKATLTEAKELLAWMQESEANRTFCMDLYKQWAKERLDESHCSVDAGWQSLVAKVNNSRRRHIRTLFYKVSSIAAAVILLLGFSYFIYQNNSKLSISQIAQLTKSSVNMRATQVELHLSSDSVIAIASKTPQIDYTSGNVTVDKSISVKESVSSNNFNQLVVPYGHRSQLTLSDGTKIWVNSGSRVVYPQKFLGKTREIYVEGEIYLDVVHDADHPFIVNSDKANVKVLGTKFDIKVYPNESLMRVVLVNGLVNVSQGNNFAILHNGYMYESYNSKPVVRLVDVNEYLSWIKGFYEFSSESLGSILKQLEKYYNINIVCDESVANVICSGKLDLSDDFSKVIESISKAAPVSFTFVDGRYCVRQRK
jgi:ferric-dicitrate binding protein FerR (iron transport regulator)